MRCIIRYLVHIFVLKHRLDEKPYCPTLLHSRPRMVLMWARLHGLHQLSPQTQMLTSPPPILSCTSAKERNDPFWLGYASVFHPLSLWLLYELYEVTTSILDI